MLHKETDQMNLSFGSCAVDAVHVAHYMKVYKNVIVFCDFSLQNEYLEKELNKKKRELELHKTQFQVKCKSSCLYT